VRARNIYGYSANESPITPATAIDAPGKMDIPTVALDTTDNTKVAISWNAVATTHGSAVTAYDVQFKTAAGTFVSDASCNPAATTTDFTNRKCIVPMTTIRTITSLGVDRVIQVRVAAINAEGSGEYSEINTSGATIETLPLTMDAPSYDSTATSNTQIKLTWNALTGTATGGSGVSITNYVVEWDQGTGTWASLAPVLSPTTFLLVTGLTGGTTYSFKTYANNKYGSGPAQLTSVAIKAGQAPDVPNPPTTSVPANSVYAKISWTAPASNSFTITQY